MIKKILLASFMLCGSLHALNLDPAQISLKMHCPTAYVICKRFNEDGQRYHFPVFYNEFQLLEGGCTPSEAQKIEAINKCADYGGYHSFYNPGLTRDNKYGDEAVAKELFRRISARDHGASHATSDHAESPYTQSDNLEGSWGPAGHRANKDTSDHHFGADHMSYSSIQPNSVLPHHADKGNEGVFDEERWPVHSF